LIRSVSMAENEADLNMEPRDLKHKTLFSIKRFLA
jgi:hypothetical protein